MASYTLESAEEVCRVCCSKITDRLKNINLKEVKKKGTVDVVI